jgi:hypothetical protein
MKRRDFLRASAVGGAAALGASVWTRRARAFGDVPPGHESSMLPENLRAQSVLECFLYGGLTPWETYYCRPNLGEVDNSFAYTFYPHLIKAAEGVGYANAGAQPFTEYKKDTAGQDIYFGPFMGRLMARADVMKRLRIVINRHTLSPHEAAIPLVASGRTLGNPALAGLATHVNRFFVDRDTNNSHPPPFSYGFVGGSGLVNNDGVLSLLAQGLHPGSARPLNIKLDAAARLTTLLNRPVIGTVDERAQYDALVNVYFEQHAARLQRAGGADALRAAKFRELMAASITQSKTNIIQSVLDPADLVPLITPSAGQEVGTDANGDPTFVTSSVGVPGTAGNLPGMNLRMASHLLTHPEYAARHVTMIDVGVKAADGGGGYDTHNNGPWRQAINFNNFIDQLLSNIKDPANPSADDARKIDLDKTMIILNSEFGRSPVRQKPDTQGRNHWPQGFAQIYIGGPIGEAQSGFYGSMDESGIATTFTTPAENRIAALLALGIWPFDAVAFSGSDAQGETQEGPAARSIIKRVLGHTV